MRNFFLLLVTILSLNILSAQAPPECEVSLNYSEFHCAGDIFSITVTDVNNSAVNPEWESPEELDLLFASPSFIAFNTENTPSGEYTVTYNFTCNGQNVSLPATVTVLADPVANIEFPNWFENNGNCLPEEFSGTITLCATEAPVEANYSWSLGSCGPANPGEPAPDSCWSIASQGNNCITLNAGENSLTISLFVETECGSSSTFETIDYCPVDPGEPGPGDGGGTPQGPTIIIKPRANANIVVNTFPNPVIDRLKVEIEGIDETQVINYSIIDLNGRKLDANVLSNTEIVTSNLNSGIYILQLFSAEEIIHTEKFIKH